MGNWIDKIKRGLALLTAAILLVSAAPVSALAEGDQGSPAVFGIAVMGQNESASYTMPQATVYLTDILDAVGFTAANNAALSVDSDVITLSHTTVKNNTLNAITLTASGYFDAATLTITKNKNSVQTILLSYPAPEIPAPQPLYLTIAFEEREQEGAEPVYQAIDAQSIPGAEVVEAFRVTENGGYTYVKPTLSALPELAAGQSLALYGVAEDGALFDYPVQENLVLGDSVSLPLSWYAGFALVRVGQALAEQTLVAQLPQELADASLTLSGLLPQGAAAEVTEQPAPAAVTPEAVLLSLDISLGDYTPQEPVTVTVTHPAFAAAQAAGKRLFVLHTGADGSLDAPEILSAAGDTLVFRTDRFSPFTFAAASVEQLDAWSDDPRYELDVYGYDVLTPTLTEAEPALEEGLELLRACQISFADGRSAALGDVSGLSLALSKNQVAETDRESVVLFGLSDGEVADTLAQDPAAEERIELGGAEGFALVKDTGFRHRSFELDAVSLDGMMPKDASAEATDARQEAQLPQEAEGDVIAAYDISILENGADYQPDADHPIAVEIADPAITAENADSIELWHIPADGPAQKIEDAVVEVGKVRFSAAGFSVYAVVETTLTKTIDASDGNTYEINVTYKNSSGIPMEGTELLVAELLPGNEKYDEYLAASAAKVGTKAENIELSRVFDIRIVDENDNSIVYEPTGDVEVSIRLVGEALGDYANLDVLHFVEDENADGFTVYDMDSIVDGETVQFTTDGFSVYVVAGYVLETTIEASDGNSYLISVTFTENAVLPDDAKLRVLELTGETYEDYLGRTAVSLDAGGFAFARIFDISIVDGNGTEIQPGDSVKVGVELLDHDHDDSGFSVVHFAGEDETAEIVDAEMVEGALNFMADSFSAYAIVQGPSAIPVGWQQISSISELTELASAGLYIGTTSGYYLTDETALGSQDKNTTGIVKTKPAQNYPADAAVRYYFEAAENTNNQFYIYCLKEEVPYYIRNTGDANVYLTNDESQRTAFTILLDNNKRFRFQNGDRYLNMWNGANANHIAAWNNPTDGNNYFYIWHYLNLDTDPYDLSGKTYGLMYWNDSIYGKAMMASSGRNNNLQAMELIVLSEKTDNTDKLFVPNDSDISMWTFEWISDDQYYLKSSVNGSEKYLSIGNNGALALVDSPTASCRIQVIPGTGTSAGKISLKASGKTLTYSGELENGFKTGGAAGTEWLYLVESSELTSDYLMPYLASKVSVSDRSVTNGSKIVLYTRVWNDNAKKYEFYVVEHDGSLVRAYESGDDIQWLGGLLNTKLWNFVEYYWEGTNDPNDYYELYNQYSDKYLAPQITGSQLLSSGTIGLNLNGRHDGYYQSTILAWDEENYAYAGLKVENGQLVTCPKSEAIDFYFAVVRDLPVDDQLTTVATVDHTQYGITMKIKNFDTRAEMSNFLGNDAYTNGRTTANLLSTDLKTNGYPTANGGSLETLFSGAKAVNHLFIASTYSGSGYYEYDSTQNYAYLDGSNFTVYKEIGTMDGSGNSKWYWHGQFMPFNNIEAGVYASVNKTNTTSATGATLGDSDPRKYERLYLVKNPDYYYGVEIEASFTQTPSGLDAWGHDIIYEFTGDDDFWLYVDGELIIDLGGIHDALPGSVNYSTGAVNVNGENTTLRALFESNYKKRNPEASPAEVAEYLAQYFEGEGTIFKDYSTHTMKIFYMERGAGAANLHMRFNLASVKPGTVELIKELEGIDKSVPVLAEFPYQIWYHLPGEEENQQPVEHLLVPNNGEGITVRYKGTIRDVTYRDSVTIDSVLYQHVFMVKPGETVVINLPEDTIDYKIVECGVNPEVYSTVTVNDTPNEGISASGSSSRKNYATDYMQAKDRPTVKYVNTVNPQALRTLYVTKQLYREDGTSEMQYTDDETTFSLRLYLGTEFESDPDTANMYAYRIKDRFGYYCTWDTATQKVVSTGWNSLNGLTEAQLASLTFNTSIYGSIAKIPAFYTVEVPNLLAGMTFRVQERPYEIPDGYSFQKYIYNGTDSTNSAFTGITDTVKANVDPHVDVCNLRGWGLRVNKVWSDASYMSSRDATYFAVFTIDGQENLTIVPSNVTVKDENDDPTTIVRQLPYGKTSVYWYFPQLPVATATSLENYVIREVKLSGTLNTNYTVDDDGDVTLSNGTTVTPVTAGETLTFNGRQNGESAGGSYEYTVVYEPGTVQDGSHVRVDKVGNNRPGILLKKTDWAGNPLKGAAFELKKDGTVLGTFVSGTDGVITTAFLSNDGAQYTLTETSSPQGYQAIPTAITLSQFAGTVTSGPDSSYYTLTQGAGTEASLTIKNRPYTFKAIKKDADTNNPISGAVFSLHKQVTVNGVISYDLNPLTGYEDLKTGNDGVIPKLDKTLPAGTYQLREKVTPGGYQPLSGHIYFTVSSTGEILLVQHPEASLDSSVDSVTGNIAYTITVTNRSKAKLTLTKQVTGDMGDRSSTNQFTFTLVSVADETSGTTYAYTKTAGGSTRSGTLTTSAGSNTFTLAHGESIVIELPLNKAVVITETNGNYTTAWSKENNTAATLTNESTASVTVTLSGDATVTVTNTLNAVAPTGLTLPILPFLLLLGAGLALGSVAVRRRKRQED